MAVLDTLAGVEVTVCINGQPVQEYEDKDKETSKPFGPKTVIKYIEAISDAEFSFTITVSNLPHVCEDQRRNITNDLIFKTKADGKYVASRICESTVQVPWIKHINGVSGLNNSGRETISLFKFATVTTVEIFDKTQIKKDTKRAAELGELIIEVHRMKITGGVAPRQQGPILPATSAIAEKAVKGRSISHSTAFGDPRETAPHPLWSCIYYTDGGYHPVARFVFRYRSKEALQKLLIIPGPPTPDPFDALSPEERDSLAREAFERRQQSLDGKEQIKVEPKIKRERERGPKRGPDVVDLTDDASAEQTRKKEGERPKKQ